MYNINRPVLEKPNVDKRLKPNSPQLIAASKGLVHFHGKSCKRGHSGLRYTKGGQCVECIGLARGISLTPRQRSNKNHQLSLEAAARGEVTYIPNKACKNGHLLRFVNSNNCVECDKAATIKHKTSAKFSRIKKEYGLSKDQYLQLVKEQNSSCKLCDTYIEDHFKLHIDHCHDTKIVRGLLCNKCNQAIGLLQHNPKLIRKAAVYCE